MREVTIDELFDWLEKLREILNDGWAHFKEEDESFISSELIEINKSRVKILNRLYGSFLKDDKNI